MLLTRTVISGYRSITNSVTLHWDPTVTVILGANDHGKTNILRAVEHLNPDLEFTAEDRSWDRSDDVGAPLIEFYFDLDDEERSEIVAAVDNFEHSHASSLQDSDGDDIPSPPQRLSPDAKKPARAATFLKTIVARRAGVGGPIRYFDGASGYELPKVLDEFTPYVELIEPISEVTDSVNASAIADRDNGFMRGIFWYAGLNPDSCSELFVQTNKTERQLDDASIRLNNTIKASWSQGKDLDFKLRHDSSRKSIGLSIKDPSVESTYVQASQRSAGFTQFFTIKTILFARQKEQAARSYLLLFDEPGMYLHPSGQQDLLQVIESLAKTHQTAYVTHSVFMINRSYPIRHRLVLKTNDGTQVEGKPYAGRWARTLSALGMSLSGTVLFASHILLTEGDSDSVYIYAVLQKAIECQVASIDINSFAAIATGRSAETDALIRLLREGSPEPKIAVLVDGDKGGRDRLAYLQPLLAAASVDSKALTDGTTIEDHLPHFSEIFAAAVCSYVSKLITDLHIEASGDPLMKIRDAFAGKFANGSPKGVALWMRDELPGIIGLKNPPSKVGIAREYAILLDAIPSKRFRLGARGNALLKWLRESLSLPAMGIDETKVLEDEDSTVSDPV